MASTSQVSNSGLGKSARFYSNPVLRDREWNHVKQAPAVLTVATLVIVGIAFILGVYADPPVSSAGWTIGIAAILVYMLLDRRRRGWARRHLRQLHGQTQT